MKPIDLSSSISTIMEFTHDGILLLDPSGMIIAANPAANSILGFNQEYNFLQSEHKFTDLFYFSDINDKNVPFEQSPVPRALKGECVVDYEGKAVNIKTGNVRYWLYSAIPIFNEQKESPGWLFR
ncbi:MAG: PAS domain-containing protein [Fibrobacter sp.]|nr:PAS domain-containing protein [Fibrobacter sp.]